MPKLKAKCKCGRPLELYPEAVNPSVKRLFCTGCPWVPEKCTCKPLGSK